MAKAKRNGKTAGKSDAAKAERYTIGRRDCILPRNINFRTQDHGDDKVQACDIRVIDIEISEEEACAFAQEKYFTRGLFVTAGRGKPDKPLLEKFRPIVYDEKIESAKVWLYLGPNAGGECALGTCKLKGIEFAFDSGRKLVMSCTVQCTPKLDHRIGELISRMDVGAQIKIEYEHNAEQIEADLKADKKPDAADADEAAARAQVDAFNRGTPVDGDVPSAETH